MKTDLVFNIRYQAWWFSIVLQQLLACCSTQILTQFPISPLPSPSLYRLHCTKEGLRIEWVGGRKSAELCYNAEAGAVKRSFAGREKRGRFLHFEMPPWPTAAVDLLPVRTFPKHGAERGGEERKKKKRGSDRRQTQPVEIFRKSKRRKLTLNCERTSGLK